LHPPSPRTITSVVIMLMATVGLGGLLARPAAADDGAPWTVKTAANSFGADRQDYGYTINPGGQVKDGIVVANHGTTPLHLALHARDNKPTGIGAWTHLNQDAVTLPPGKSVEVPFTITLPDDAAPGDYVGDIVTSLAQADEVGIPIRLRVGGALKPSLAVERLHVDYSNGDAAVTYTIHNTGNAILTARQAVSASGPFGRWAVNAGRIADSPALLPGERWKASAPLRGVTPALRLTATVTLVPLLTDAAGSTAPLAATKASEHAWTVPWSLLLAVVVVCGLVVAGVAFRPRRRVRALQG
jgi:hypothetical protein